MILPRLPGARAAAVLALFLWLSYPSRSAPEAAPPVYFDVAAASGIGFRQNNFATDTKFPFETMGGAVAALDYNNDGLLDLLFLNGAPSPDHVRTDPASFNRLYRNEGNRRFKDVTLESGLSGQGIKGYPQGVAVADYDNDGFVDVCVTNYGDTVLYHNNGNGTFSDVTARAGVAMGRYPFKASACWLDADGDGFLDLFVTHYFQWTFAENTDSYCGQKKPGYRTYCTPDVFKPLPNVLFRNNRDGTFTDVSERAGLNRYPGKGMGVTAADYDRDGRPDIFVTNDKVPNFLYRNRGGGMFEEVALQAGVYANESGAMVSGMGCDFNDFDNDGLPDIFYSDLVKEFFTLFRNGGDGLFEDVTFASGIGSLSAPHSGWSTKFCDLDNDGWKDLFVAGSHVVDNVELFNPSARYKEPCFIYRNLGGKRFEDWSTRIGGDPRPVGANRGVAVGDFDNDGSLEIAVNRLNDTPLFLARNEPGTNHWITLALEGRRSNRDGLGAEVEITLPSGAKQFNLSTTANGIYSASDKRVHFGLGSHGRIRTIQIRWPGGQVQTLKDVAADQVLKVTETEKPANPR